MCILLKARKFFASLHFCLLLFASASNTGLSENHTTNTSSDPCSNSLNRLIYVDEDGFPVIRGVTFDHTNRPLEKLRTKNYLRGELAAKRLKLRKVLDLPAGGGAATRDLRNEGIDAIGIDLHWDSKNGPRPSYVLEADWNNLPFANEHFDTIMMNYGAFTYSLELSDQALSQALQEAVRVCKKGGEIFILGVEEPERLKKLAKQAGLVESYSYNEYLHFGFDDREWTFRFVKP